MREVLAYDLFDKAGVAAPHAGFAQLYLTVEDVYCREHLGLYTVVEHLDEQFLFLYHNTGSGRYELIPLDLNEAFGSFRMGSARQMLDLDVYRPSAGKKILVARLLSIGAYRARYTQCVTDLVEGPFRVGRAHRQIERLYTLIRGAALADTHKLYSGELFEKSIYENVALQSDHPPGPARPAPPPGRAPERRRDRRPTTTTADEIIGLKPFVARRVESITAQLKGERRGYVVEP